MPISEQNVTGKKYRVWDAANNIWKRFSFWTKASDVELNDGTTVEDTIGALISDLTASDDLVFNFTKSGTKYGYEDLNGNFVPFKTVQASKTVTASTSTMTVKPSSGYDGLGQVIVNPQQHSGTFTASSASSSLDMGVNHNNRYVDTSGLIVKPTATKAITANGNNIDVLNYAKVNVSVPDSHNCKFGSVSVNYNASSTINCGFYPKYVICALACSGRGTGWAYINNRGSYVCRWTSTVGSCFGTGIDWTYYISITLSSTGFTVTNKTNENATVYYLAAL